LSGERIVLADDHPPVRAGVREALERDGFAICAEAGDGPSAVAAALRERPDIVLMDVHMPGNGIAATKEISRQLPDTAIVMLTVSTADTDLFDALRAGASGYLLKDIDPARLPDALRGVLAGEAALPRRLVALVLDEFRHRKRHKRLTLVKGRGVDLTEREWDVLELLRQGLSTAEIGERMFIAPVTVRTHVSAILKKLHVSNRSEAVELANR
jgi:DNA-binding NarL/FixJ family response regulator